MPRFHIESKNSDAKRFHDLPLELKEKIGSFLDPSSKISYLKGVQPVYREPETNRKPSFHCPFCVVNIWYHDLPMGQVYGEGEDFSFTLRNKLDSATLVVGADKRDYIETNFRRRHYSAKEDEEEITKIFHYFGKF